MLRFIEKTYSSGWNLMRQHLRAAVAVCFLVTTSSLVGAEDVFAHLAKLSPEQRSSVMNNLQHDYVTCAAFFGLTVAAVGTQDSKTAEAYEKAMNQAIVMATELAELVPMSKDATQARLELSVEQMTDQINGNFNNVSILTNEHLATCEMVMSNTEARIAYWIDRSSQSQ